MLAEEKLTISAYARNYLLQNPDFVALVGNKVYPSVAPENTPSPYVIYERDAYATFDTKFGVYQEEAQVFFEVYSDDYDTGMEIIVKIHNILQGKHGGFRFDVINSAEYYKEKKFRQAILFKIS